MVRIPTGIDPYSQQQTNLDGDDYILVFRFNSREQVWYMDVQQTDGTPLVQALKLVCNNLLIDQFADTDLPLGDFIVTDATGLNSPPGLLDLDPDTGRCTLNYLEQDDLIDVTTYF